ncbi:MAG: aminotransferase class V-fold PLP-dependent enzyme [Planctomycetota bacterium]|nr:aminotransferase class V-fold PLP-dependent enzyme [Planctomycetota bacterium]
MPPSAAGPSAYLDNNATTPVAEEVLVAMLPWFRDEPGNPSSLHASGERANAALAAARTKVARLFGAGRPAEVTFTSGATEATNLAIHAVLQADPRRRVVTSAVEHPATSECLGALDLDLVTVGVDGAGGLLLDDALAAIDEQTALCTLILANNETGRLLEPRALTALAARCREVGARLHLDAVQAAGKLPLELAAWGADLASLSAHKLHGPKGVGALWVREGCLGEVAPLLRGGPQERGRRAGTENLPGIVGFGAAAELACRRCADPSELRELRDRLEAGILAAVPDAVVAAAGAPRVAGTSCIEFHGIDGEAALLMLSHLGVEVSTGSACGSSHHAPSHVLLAMGRSEAEAASSLRLSLSHETSAEEVDHCLATLPGVISALRSLAPR